MRTSLRRRVALAVLVPCSMMALAGCAASAPSGAPGANRGPVAHQGSTHGLSVAAVSTTTTLPQCGFARDPFDPTNAPAPAGLCP